VIFRTRRVSVPLLHQVSARVAVAESQLYRLEIP
jgi:hypothetical protein